MIRTSLRHILVTGGAGYIGSVLIPRLLRERYEVTVFDSLYFGKQSMHAFIRRVHVIQGDVRHPPNNLFCGITDVIHLAALSNDPTAEFNPRANTEINTGGTKIIAKLAKRAGVKRFILASSCSIYDRGLNSVITTKKETDRVFPRNPYSRSKYFAEREILKLGDASFSPIVLRKGTAYGYSPRMRYDLIINTMVRDAFRNHNIHVFCRGNQWRPLVAVEDIAEAYVLALQKPRKILHKQIINIASGNYRVSEVALAVQHVFQERMHLPIELIYEDAFRRDRSYRVSTARAKKLLGFTPSNQLEDDIYHLAATIRHDKSLQQYERPIYYNITWMKPILQQMSK